MNRRARRPVNWRARRPVNRRLVAALLFAFLMPAPSRAQDSESRLTLEILMEQMAKTSGVRAHFRERKEISLLSAPIETHGVLYFVPPDRLARHTLEPGRAVLVIDGDSVRFFDASVGEPVDLSSDPIARQFAQNFAVLFNGDLASLRERYRVSFRSDGDHWELALDPRSAAVREFVRDITLRGRGATLLEMVWRETDGDQTTTRFDEVETNRAFSDEELDRAFPSGKPWRDPGSPVP